MSSLENFRLDRQSLVTTVLYVGGLTLFNAIIISWVQYRAVGMISLMAITVGALIIRDYNIYLASVLGGICWNVFFIPPRFTLHVAQKEDILLLVLFIVAGVVIGIFKQRLEEKERILRSNLLVEESERIYKTLLNSVSHELRTPLAAIKGFASVLRDKTNLSSEVTKEIAEEIGVGVERLDHVVQNLLDMSRIESGNLRLNREFYDVADIVNEAVRKVKRTHGERPVGLAISKDPPVAFVDYFLIEQTVENVLRNAFLYSPNGLPVDVSVSQDKHNISIKISDYGPGINGQDTSVVFRKFFRGRPESTGGLGLGLSICKAIVELHGGTIEAENLPEKGARFTIVLPTEKAGN
jgi:two-component system sensor histidine kinase KdpD